MKTPDEIKKGLECCTVEYCYHTQKGCPYRDYILCVQNVCADALAYIQQLERERDAAVEDLETMGEARPYCGLCAHEKVGIDEAPCGTCREGYIENNWQWRGVQEVE